MYIGTLGIFVSGIVVGITLCSVSLVIYGVAIIRKDKKNRANRGVDINDNSR